MKISPVRITGNANSVLAVCVALSLGFFATVGQAAPGDLDPTFGTGGKVTTVFGHNTAFDVAIQTDGKIVVVGGSGDFALARYNPDGTLDTSFGSNGLILSDLGEPFDEAFAVTILPDGKILLAGAAGCDNFALARYNPDGSLDIGFDGDGKVTTDFGSCDRAFAVAVQADGKIVAVGHSLEAQDFALARYNADGSLDVTFGNTGKVVTDFGGYDAPTGVSIQKDGKIVVGGAGGPNDFALARYNPDGTLDASFGISGKVLTDFGGYDAANDLALQADGKIVLAGVGGVFNGFAVARYNTDGTLDASFGDDGRVTTRFFGESVETANGLAIQPDGKIVAVGFAYSSFDPSFALTRYNTDGSLDQSFGTAGIVTTDFGDPGDVGVLCPPARKDCSEDIARKVAIQPDGKIVVVGGAGAGVPSRLIALARYEGGAADSDQDGVPDDRDKCPNTPQGATADAHGCSIDQLVPCAGPASGGAWKNHGNYVSAVAKSTKAFLKAGLITQDEAEAIVGAAARSNCGKRSKPGKHRIHHPHSYPL